MPRKAKELSILSIKRLTKKGRYAVGGVAGLNILVNENGAKSWLLRAIVGSKRKDIGLGGYPDVSLAEAKERAREARLLIRNGIDPVLKRKEAKAALIKSQLGGLTFAEATEKYINLNKSKWKTLKYTETWASSIKTYAYPVIGQFPIRDIELQHIVSILEPIWTAKTETASRLRGRLENVFDWAIVSKYRTSENPARWKGYLDKVLPSPHKIATVSHHKSMPIDQVSAFIQQISKTNAIASKALTFLILTATRSNEVRGATWDEIDFEKMVWTIPAKRMKAGKEHRIPLAPQAVEILQSVPRLSSEQNLIFPSPYGGKLSDVTLLAVMRRLNIDAVPHGFRSTFRDWVAEHTSYPNHVAEMALAHTISNKVEAAYRRGDLFDKRREMMNDWARFCYYLPIHEAKHRY